MGKGDGVIWELKPRDSRLQGLKIKRPVPLALGLRIRNIRASLIMVKALNLFVGFWWESGQV